MEIFNGFLLGFVAMSIWLLFCSRYGLFTPPFRLAIGLVFVVFAVAPMPMAHGAGLLDAPAPDFWMPLPPPPEKPE